MKRIDNQTKGLRTWIEIDQKAIKHNVAKFRSLIARKTKLCAVVKSNAYGHGLVLFSKEAVAAGVDFLAVDSVVEGLKLRKEGIKLPILILGYTLPEMFKDAVAADLSMTISHFEGLEEIINVGKAYAVFGGDHRVPRIHIKVDTGMHRQGFVLSDSKKLLKILRSAAAKKLVVVEGLFTHFAAAKNPAFPETTQKQLDEFKKWLAIFHKAKLNPMAHAAATSGTILFSQSHFDMVRVGIGLYGLWPSIETRFFAEQKRDAVSLKPVLTWKTLVSEIKNLPDGGKVGYDLTEKVGPKSRLAICPIGYWHGFPRAFSGIGRVLIKGQFAKVIGRVSMDMIVVDVSRIKNVKIRDEVVLIGRQGDKSLGAQEISNLVDTSWYELVAQINPLIKKIII